MTTRSTHRALTVTAVAALFALPVGASLATPREASDQQPICHATSSDSNPYVLNSPDRSGDLAGHAGHLGPLWTADLKAEHVSWGDIIPPFDYVVRGTTQHFAGLNWTTAGQAWFANGCQAPVTPTPPPTTPPPTTPPPTTPPPTTPPPTVTPTETPTVTPSETPTVPPVVPPVVTSPAPVTGGGGGVVLPPAAPVTRGSGGASTLPFTGGPPLWLVLTGLWLIGVGAGLQRLATAR